MTALVENSYAIDPTLIFPGNFTREGGEQAINRIAHLEEKQRPTAIFGANDETAFGILLGIRKQGWRVPNDLEVCGFGDLPFAQLVAPALTTVHIPLRELGRTGARDLLKLLNNEEIAPLKILPTEIVERETTAPLHPQK
jgi:DNA-binding LacI/PurR family transcriptional regulator